MNDQINKFILKKRVKKRKKKENRIRGCQEKSWGGGGSASDIY